MSPPTRRQVLATTSAGLVAALAGCTEGSPTSGPTPTTDLPRFDPPPDRGPLGPTPVLGVLEPTVGAAGAMVAAGVRRAVLSVGWDRLEPRRGAVDAAHLAALRRRLGALRAAGYRLVLDPGFQYPPPWVLRGRGARFVDQDGRAWRGSSSEDVPDAVWDAGVRDAQRRHLARLADLLGARTFAAVRVGGLLSGELRMPPARSDGREHRLWGYGAAARAAAPSAWRPGTGTPEQARRWLDWYCSSLSGYALWLAGTTARAFPGTELQALVPGWGLRPGDLDAAAADRGLGTSPAVVGGSVSAGLDWPGQVRALAGLRRGGVDVVVHSTWLDAAAEPGEDSDPRAQAPPTWLFGLARAAGLDVGGENTGGGGAQALERVRAQVERFPLRSVTWMSEAALTAPGAAVRAADVVGLQRH